MKQITAVDLFCGAGGTSTGLLRAADALGCSVRLTAINHWQTAIDTHTLNHPGVNHLCENITAVNPRHMLGLDRIHLLLASPECTDHSIARGDRPIDDQRRASAWDVVRWASELYIDHILVENVKEFKDWGPIGADGRKLKSKKGETFRAFVAALEALGYRVEWRILCAADYGAATARYRLFLQAARGRARIRWPKPTHSKTGGFGMAKWRAAREIVDWSLPSQSIFTRKRPLAANTLRRIAAGIEKFWGPWAEPFLILLNGGGSKDSARTLDLPLPTVVSGGGHVGLVEPFVLTMEHTKDKKRGHRDIQHPLNTITTADAHGIVQPFIVPFLSEAGHQTPRTGDIHKPLQTVTTSNPIGLCTPFIASINHGTPDGNHARRAHDLDAPLPTQSCKNGFGLCEPFLVKYYGAGEGLTRLTDPLDTVTTRDRFGLVQTAQGPARLDILFRMLQPAELSAAMGFPEGYQFSGTRADATKQIGNAVEVHQAQALTAAILAALAA